MWTLEKPDDTLCVEDTCSTPANAGRLCSTHRAQYGDDLLCACTIGIDWDGDLFCVGCALDNGYIACTDVTPLDQADTYAVCSSCQDFLNGVPL